MSNEEQGHNEFLDLPDDPEVAFAVLQKRKLQALEDLWETKRTGGWYDERRFVDTLIAFDEVHDLGLLIAYRNPPNDDSAFAEFFQDFRRSAEISSQKILMEAARRLKTGSHQVVVLDAAAREAIHRLINAIREKLNELSLDERKRESLFSKLNEFASEIDRNRTRSESFFSFAVEIARATREVNDEIKPIQQTIDRILDWIEKAQKWKDTLPSWEERKKLKPPLKNYQNHRILI